MPRRPDRNLLIALGATLSAVALLAFALRPDDVGTAAVADAAPEVDAPAGTPEPVATEVVEVPSPTPPAPTTDASAAATEPATVTLAFAGDVHGEEQIAAGLAAGSDLLADVAGVLTAADVAVVNLETAVGERGARAPKTYSFQAPPALLPALARAGVDVVSVANNHALDRGVEGLRETLALARSSGLVPVGGGEDAADAYAPAVYEVRGLRVAIIGLSRVFPTHDWAAGADRPGLASGYDTARAVDAVRAARAGADHVVVVVHWGTERAACPDTSQVDLAEALHAAGAQVVVGAHPHRVQGISRPTPTQLTAWSLGNFLWYAAGEESGRTGVLTVTLDRSGVVDVAVEPFRIGPDGAPRPADQPDARALERAVSERVPGVACPVAGIPRR